MKCPFPLCGYEWTSRKLYPKECPKCKRYIKVVALVVTPVPPVPAPPTQSQPATEQTPPPLPIIIDLEENRVTEEE